MAPPTTKWCTHVCHRRGYSASRTEPMRRYRSAVLSRTGRPSRLYENLRSALAFPPINPHTHTASRRIIVIVVPSPWYLSTHGRPHTLIANKDRATWCGRRRPVAAVATRSPTPNIRRTRGHTQTLALSPAPKPTSLFLWPARARTSSPSPIPRPPPQHHHSSSLPHLSLVFIHHHHHALVP